MCRYVLRVFVKEDGHAAQCRRTADGGVIYGSQCSKECKARTLMSDYKERQRTEPPQLRCLPEPPLGLTAAIRETVGMCMAVPHAARTQLFVERPPEAFFYPQRIWMGFCSSGLMLALWLYKTSVIREWLTEKLATFHYRAQDFVMSGIQKLSRLSASSLLFGSTVLTNSNPDLSNHYTIARNLDDLIHDLRRDVDGALWTGQFFAISLWSIGWISMFLNFRNDALKLRRGDYPFDLHKDRAPFVSDACAYAGMQMATATIGYVVQTGHN